MSNATRAVEYMLATAICLDKYMRHDLPSSTRDAIEKEWLTKWKERLCNPTRTPRQVMRAYVEDLDITVTSLDYEMDWDSWEGEIDPIHLRLWTPDMMLSPLMR